MNSAQVQALINRALSQWRTISFGQISAASLNNLTRQNGGATVCSSGILSISTGVGANKFRHVSLENTNGELRTYFAQAGTVGIRCLINHENQGTVGGRAGVQLLSPYNSGVDTSPPWNDPPAIGYVRALAHTESDDSGFWELSAAVGDGATALTTVTSSIPAFHLQDKVLSLEVDILESGQLTAARLTVGGIVAASITDSTKLPNLDTEVGQTERWSAVVESTSDAASGVQGYFGWFQMYGDQPDLI